MKLKFLQKINKSKNKEAKDKNNDATDEKGKDTKSIYQQ